MSAHSLAAPKKASAANIKIRPATPVQQSETSTLFERLNTLLRDLAPGTKKNDQVTALIIACITEGIVTKKVIIGIAVHFGFHRFHVAKMLEYGLGYDPSSGHWRRNHDGSFSLFV